MFHEHPPGRNRTKIHDLAVGMAKAPTQVAYEYLREKMIAISGPSAEFLESRKEDFAMHRHLARQINTYGQVVVVNLLNYDIVTECNSIFE